MSAARRTRPERREATGDPSGPRIPAWLPFVLYGALTLVLFRAFIFSSAMLVGQDTLSLGYMVRAFYADALSSGVFPLWNPVILGGTPFIESLAGGDSLYPPSVLLLVVMDTHRALGWKLVLHIFAAGLFMFGWVRTLGRSRAAALLAGLAYGMAPVLVSFVAPGHDGKIFVIALTPLVFWACERTFSRGTAGAYVAFAFAVAVVLLTTHFQLAYFLFGGVGAFAFFRSVQIWRGGGGDGGASPRGARPAAARFGLFLLASLAGAGVAGIQLFPAVDYVTEYSRRTATTTRAGADDNVAYSSSFSLHPEEALSFVVPEFAGNGAGGADWATGTYWGRNGLKNNHEYVGLVVLLLATLSFFGAPRRGLRMFFTSLGATALLFALGRHTPVWRLFYEVLPGISLFRAPSTATFLFGFSAATLAAFGVDRVLDWTRGEEPSPGAARTPWILAGALLLLFVLAASGILLSAWTSVVYPSMQPFAAAALERARPFVVRGAFVAAFLGTCTAAVVWAGRRALLASTGVVVLLGALLALDAMRVDAPFIQTMSAEAWAAPDPNIEFLVERQREADAPFRVVSFANAAQSVRPGMFGLELATGHHPNDLARYRELIGMRGSGMPEYLVEDLSADLRLFKILGVRYLMWPAAELGASLGGRPVSATQVGGELYEAVYELPAFPVARLVAEARVVPDDQVVATLRSPDVDPETTVVLSEEPPIALPGGVPVGEVTWEERGINRMRLRVSSDRNAVLVIAENWFPSWRASVDGASTPLLRVYHSLRGVPVAAGEHVVELEYRSPLLRWSLITSVLTTLALFALAALARLRRERHDESRPPTP